MPNTRYRVSQVNKLEALKMIKEISCGNDRATLVLKSINIIDPNSLYYFYTLKKHRIYGENVDTLFAICDRDLDKFREVVKSIANKEITTKDIIKACPMWDNRISWWITFKNVLKCTATVLIIKKTYSTWLEHQGR